MTATTTGKCSATKLDLPSGCSSESKSADALVRLSVFPKDSQRELATD
jgi:hypothetical protein